MKKSILIIPSYRLYPVDTGAGVAQLSMIQALSEQMEVCVVLDENNVYEVHRLNLQETYPEVRFIMWDDLKRNWEEAIASSWLKQLKYRFRRSIEEEVFPPLSSTQKKSVSWKNCSILFQPYPEWRSLALQHFLKRRTFDYVQSDMPAHLPLLGRVQSDVKKIHVCHELKSKRFRNAQSYTEADEGLASLIAKRESELLKQHDLVLCFNKDDQLKIRNMGVEKVEISPFALMENKAIPNTDLRPKRLLFIGPESHGPNREGLLWFLTELCPNGIPPLPLDVVGKWSLESIKKFSTEHIRFHGFVDDLTPLLKGSIMLVPIRSGAGLRTKILEAMQRTVPVLCTPFSAEGIEAEGALSFFDNHESFMGSLAEINKPEIRLERIQKASDYIAANFSQQVLGKRRADILTKALDI